MKKQYKAIAIVTDGIKEWNVTIYKHYETITDAEEGIKNFKKHGYNVIKTWIE